MDTENWNSQFDIFVGHFTSYQQPDINESDAHLKLVYRDADIGRKVGFQRIAVHHITLPPNSRTSLPHAESLDEEFVYVLKGEPDLWLNGFIHRLKVGHAVGFPASA
jgi:uncharacterized cupin superfamily protein